MVKTVRIWVIAAALLVSASAASAYEKVKTGGSIGNSYTSTMARVDDQTMRITTRQRISGDLEEVNKPGTTMYQALDRVQKAAALRAALEAQALGYKVLEVQGSRDLSSVQEMRAASKGDTPATGFTFAPGVYHNDVELVIEIVVKGLSGDMPKEANPKLLDVDAVLKYWNLKP
jgi:hypothetical protein